MDLFKLLFEHDQRLDRLRTRHTDRERPETSSSLEDFLKPDPTYSRFYLSGSRPDSQRFGLTTLDSARKVLQIVADIHSDWNGISSHSDEWKRGTLSNALPHLVAGEFLLLYRGAAPSVDVDRLSNEQPSGLSHGSEALHTALEQGDRVLYAEQAHHGLDLHLVCRENIYRELFTPLKELVDENFRFFSMNGKRIRSERLFFFDTWRLEQPPHGIEEVYSETVL